MNNSFMIAATGSGCGKTYITCGLLEALKGRGEVRAFKCGPDYIDPMFHKNVLMEIYQWWKALWVFMMV